MPTQILIADDHALYRKGMCDLIRQFDADAQILEAGDWRSALALLEQYPDSALAVIDLNMPGMETFEGLRAFLDRAETVPVVVMSASESPLDMKRALDAGAMGYIAKSETAAVMSGALRLVLAGGIYVPPRLIQSASLAPAIRSNGIPFGLTPRQYDVLKLLVQDKSNKAIAQELKMSDRTVKAHVGAIFKALGATNRQQVIKMVASTSRPADPNHSK